MMYDVDDTGGRRDYSEKERKESIEKRGKMCEHCGRQLTEEETKMFRRTCFKCYKDGEN